MQYSSLLSSLPHLCNHLLSRSPSVYGNLVHLASSSCVYQIQHGHGVPRETRSILHRARECSDDQSHRLGEVHFAKDPLYSSPALSHRSTDRLKIIDCRRTGRSCLKSESRLSRTGHHRQWSSLRSILTRYSKLSYLDRSTLYGLQCRHLSLSTAAALKGTLVSFLGPFWIFNVPTL